MKRYHPEGQPGGNVPDRGLRRAGARHWPADLRQRRPQPAAVSATPWMEASPSWTSAGSRGPARSRRSCLRSSGSTWRPATRSILYTDGVTEALNGEGEMFGEERLVGRDRRLPGRQARTRRFGAICGALAAFTGGRREPADDVTVVVVRRWAQDG